MVKASSADGHVAEPGKTSSSSKVSKSKLRRVSSTAGDPKSSKPAPSKEDIPPEAATESMSLNEKEAKKTRKKRQQGESDHLQSTPADPAPVQAEEWSWIPLANEEQAGHSAVFSKDGQYFFVPSGSSIKVYAVETLKIVSTFSPLRSSSASLSPASPHTDLVTSVLLNPFNPLQLYSASLDGTIKIWDWLEGTLLRTLDFGKPISHMCAHPECPDVVFVAGRNAKVAMKQKHGRTTNSKAECTVARVSLTDQSQKSRKIGKKIAPVTGLFLSADGKFLIATAATTVHIAFTSSPEKGWIKFVSPDGVHLTRLVCHPSHNYFATGDKSGHIRIWDCLQDESQLTFEKLGVAKTPTTRLMHWHAHEVGALAFTPNGAFLISGGVEAVMVLWNMDSGRRGNVPRVGAPIQGISTVDRPDAGQEILLGLADGSFAMYNVTKGRFRVQTGSVKLASSRLNDAEPVLAVDPQRRRLALASFHPASIQIHSLLTSDSVQEVEVAPSNRVSSKDKPVFITPTTVTQATFDHTGRWLATIDGREASLDSSAAWYLKFWELRDTSKGDRYVLNTRIDLPHGYERIVMVEFCNPATVGGPLKLATAGEDGTVKIWGARGPIGQESWVNRATLTYREETPSHLSFSPDGSVLAVAHGSYVTLWDGQTHALLYAVSSLPFRKVNIVHFVGTNGRYLVVSGDSKDAIVWDVLKNKAVRRVSTTPPTSLSMPKTSHNPLVVPIPNSDHFVVAARHPNQTLISIHSRRQSDPIRTRSLPFHVLRLAPLPSSPDRFVMATIAADGSVSLVGDDLTLFPEREGDVERSLSSKRPLSARPSLFENVFGRSAFKDLDNVDNIPQPSTEVVGADDRFGAAVDLRLLDGPAYLLPPIETLFTSLMEGVLVKPLTNTEQEKQDEDTGMDVDLDEAPEDNIASAPLLRPREVDESEISMLVDLFSQHALIAPSNTKKGSRLGNGSGLKKPHLNGKTQVNGITASAGTHLPSPSPTPSPVTSIPAAKAKAKQKANGIPHPSPSTGQKRKVPPTS
ncbi:hypothetical protein M407DRAFT_25424 [Tulasnella calospora MUT 4182]|uniref:WD repeat-containing protein 75 second beta-propeller domain-containing protein n=1 Tax=Tulasnella calospora MUT 4182 TaxID=1051891 RepID=A0A0C3Q6W3_9AGAM|nr:hypothetical protein M407DRAFT_25424 [Tulasnella calospora MUT 4182]